MHVGVHTIAFAYAYADEHRVAFASVEKALHMLVPVVVCADRVAFAYADEHRVAFASVEKALHMLVPVVVCADRVAFAYAEEHIVAFASVEEAFHMVVWGDRVAFASSAVMHMVLSHSQVLYLENWKYSASFADNVLGFVKTEPVLPVLNVHVFFQQKK